MKNEEAEVVKCSNKLLYLNGNTSWISQLLINAETCNNQLINTEETTKCDKGFNDATSKEKDSKLESRINHQNIGNNQEL